MEVTNTTSPAATQNSGLHRMFVSHCCIVLLSVVFCFNVFFLFAVNFVIFSLRATILLNLNLNLNLSRQSSSRSTSVGPIYKPLEDLRPCAVYKFTFDTDRHIRATNN